MELSKKIYQLRKLAGMTQAQLAEKLSISRQTLSKWENGTSVPDVESVVRLSALFHTSLEELLLEEENRVKEEKTHSGNRYYHSHVLKDAGDDYGESDLCSVQVYRGRTV